MTSKVGPAAVIGSGPNGLAAAVTLARAGIDVTVFEADDEIGGGTRTRPLVLEDVVHDVCSAVHPMALASPFFQAFELTKRVEFMTPDVSYAHPLDERPAVLAYRDLARTADDLGRDGEAYRRLFAPLVQRVEAATEFALGGSMLRIPSPTGVLVGMRVLELGTLAGRVRFQDERARALITGVAAHSIGRLPSVSAAAIGVMLSLYGHVGGWPVPRGGSAAITRALADDFRRHGGTIHVGRAVEDIHELDQYTVKIFATSPRALTRIAGEQLPPRYRRVLNKYSYGPAAAKVDFVLDGPVPWRDPRVGLSATVHVGGTHAEIAHAENMTRRGHLAERPFVLVSQPSRFDDSRAPRGKHVLWTYAHVPNGSNHDVTEAVTAQIERFAPGFRDRVVAHHVTTAQGMEAYNANYVGGDINVGAVSLKQLIARPALSAQPWRTPVRGVYLASSATPPGPGVHGLPGWFAAQHALREEYGLGSPSLAKEP